MSLYYNPYLTNNIFYGSDVIDAAQYITPPYSGYFRDDQFGYGKSFGYGPGFNSYHNGFRRDCFGPSPYYPSRNYYACTGGCY